MGFEKGIVSLLFPGSSQIVDSMSRCKREEITTLRRGSERICLFARGNARKERNRCGQAVDAGCVYFLTTA